MSLDTIFPCGSLRTCSAHRIHPGRLAGPRKGITDSVRTISLEAHFTESIRTSYAWPLGRPVSDLARDDARQGRSRMQPIFTESVGPHDKSRIPFHRIHPDEHRSYVLPLGRPCRGPGRYRSAARWVPTAKVLACQSGIAESVRTTSIGSLFTESIRTSTGVMCPLHRAVLSVGHIHGVSHDPADPSSRSAASLVWRFRDDGFDGNLETGF